MIHINQLIRLVDMSFDLCVSTARVTAGKHRLLRSQQYQIGDAEFRMLMELLVIDRKTLLWV